jgi:hypothetical protein
MRIEGQKHRLHDADLPGASIVNALLVGMTIEGVPVTDLLSFWRAGREAQSA